MIDRIRSSFAVVLACTTLLLAAGSAFAQDAAPGPRTDRSSPRALYDTFFHGRNEIDRMRSDDERRAAFETAVIECLDREGVRADPLAVAADLHEVLNLSGRIAIAELPGPEYSEEFHDLPLGGLDGAVVTVTREDDQWRFAAHTLRRLPEFLRAYQSSDREAYVPSSLRRAIEDVAPSLVNRALFLEHWQWLGLVLLAIAAFILHKIIGFILGSVIQRVLERRQWLAASATAASAAGRPAGLFGVAFLIMFAGPWLELPPEPVNLHRWLVVIAAKMFLSLGAVMILYRLADVVAARLADAAAQSESKLDDQLVPIVRKSLKIIVAVGGILFILDNMEADIWSLLAGASVAGVAVAFAAKDTIANLFGSVTVFLDRPFQVGDSVSVGGVSGTVEEVGFRSTRVRTFHNSLVTVPNSQLVDSAVDNMGLRTFRRFKTTIGIQYDTPAEKIEAFCAGVRGIILANPDMRHESFGVYLNDWGASSLNILCYVHFDVPGWAEELVARQNFMLEVIRLADDLGVGFAFPTTTLHVDSTPEHPPRQLQAPSEDEMEAIIRKYARGGEASRPTGTARFHQVDRDRGDPETDQETENERA